MGILCMMLVSCCHERAEVAAFTESLAKLRSEFRTVQIEFTLTRTDAVFKTTAELNCRFLIFRAKDGTQHATLTLFVESKPNDTETWVLRGDDLYELNNRTKIVTKHTAAKEGLLAYTASVWPGVRLLDHNEAGKQCDIRVLKRGDTNYSYFTMKVTGGETYRFAVAKRDGSIKRLYVDHANGDKTQLQVTKWAVDAVEGINAKDLPPDPTILPEGWRMEVWHGWNAISKQLWKTLKEAQKAQQNK